MRELEKARSGSLFASPLLTYVWPDGPEFNVQLKDAILEHARGLPAKS